MDLVFGEVFGQSRLLLNLKRHAAWRGEPRVGKPLVFDVYGPAAEIWFLAYSIFTSNLSLPPYGTLFLDPVSLQVC